MGVDNDDGKDTPYHPTNMRHKECEGKTMKTILAKSSRTKTCFDAKTSWIASSIMNNVQV